MTSKSINNRKIIFVVLILVGVAVFLAKFCLVDTTTKDELLVQIENKWTALISKMATSQIKLPEPGPKDWLSQHEEDGQTFSQYLRDLPLVPERSRTKIFVKMIGVFDDQQRKVVNDAVDWLGAFYNLSPAIDKLVLIEDLKDVESRVRDGRLQLSTQYIMNQVMWPNIPEEAGMFLVVTTYDLWPGDNWGYVFGDSDMHRGLGVVSMARFGDSNENYQSVLKRLIKIATHECGHQRAINHCIQFSCGMNGINNIDELDRIPSWFCSHCMAKVHVITGVQNRRRIEDLVRVSRRLGLVDTVAHYDNYLKLFPSE